MYSLTTLFGDDASILHETNFKLLLLAAILPILGTGIVAPILDSLIQPFQATSANIGWMISAFTAPAIVMIPLAGMLSDRFDRKVVLTFSLLLFGIGGTAIATTGNFHVALFYRFLQGIGFAGINPILITSIGDLYQGGKEETAQGLRFMISSSAGAAFPLIAGVIVVFAWQFPFLLYAAAFPIAGSVYLWYDDPTADIQTRNIEKGRANSYVTELYRLSRQRHVLAIIIARAIAPAIWIGFITYNSLVVIRILGGTPMEAGIIVAVEFIVAAISASQAGRITDFFNRRLYPLIVANLSLTLGFVLFLYAPSLAVATIGVIILGIGVGIVSAFYRSIITSLAPDRLRGGLVSISEAAGRLVTTLTPLGMGLAIATASPAFGFAQAIRWAGVTVAILGGGGGIICIIIATISSNSTKISWI